MVLDAETATIDRFIRGFVARRFAKAVFFGFRISCQSNPLLGGSAKLRNILCFPYALTGV